MKKHIDLFSLKKQQESLAPIVVKTKKILTIGLILFGTLFVLQFVLYAFLNIITSNVSKKQITLTAFLQQNKGLDNKIAFFLYKKNLLQRYVKDDAQFVSYYNLFQKIINDANLNVRLESFVVNKDRSTACTLNFTDYEASQEFIKAIETSVFLDHFSELTLLSFIVSSRKSDAGVEIPIYKLELKGIFKEINANKS